MKFKIVHEDKHILIVSKPPGLLAAPIKSSRALNLKTLLDKYLEHKKQVALVVHRIDRYTSGLMVFSKNRKSREKLTQQFLAHTPERVYLAVVRGIVTSREGKLVHHLKLIKTGFRQVVVQGEKEGGKLAVTRYRVLDTGTNCSLVEINLETGLKNQVRIQLAQVNHPIVGDRHYCASEKNEPLIQRQALHAYKLGFIHPGTGQPVMYQVNPPKDFTRLVKKFFNFQFKKGI